MGQGAQKRDNPADSMLASERCSGLSELRQDESNESGANGLTIGSVAGLAAKPHPLLTSRVDERE